MAMTADEAEPCWTPSRLSGAQGMWGFPHGRLSYFSGTDLNIQYTRIAP
jgi:hypothetical protein